MATLETSAARASKRSIAAAMADAKLLGSSFPELESWGVWLAVLKAAFAEPLDWKERHAGALEASSIFAGDGACWRNRLRPS